MPWYSFYTSSDKKLINFQVWENGERVHLHVAKDQIRNFFEKYSNLTYQERNPTFQLLPTSEDQVVPLFFRLDFSHLMEQCHSEDHYKTTVYELMHVFLKALFKDLFQEPKKHFDRMVVLDHSKARVLLFFPTIKIKQPILKEFWQTCIRYLNNHPSPSATLNVSVDWRNIITYNCHPGMKLRLPYCKSDPKNCNLETRQLYYVQHHMSEKDVEDHFHYAKSNHQMSGEELIDLLHSICLYEIE